MPYNFEYTSLNSICLCKHCMTTNVSKYPPHSIDYIYSDIIESPQTLWRANTSIELHFYRRQFRQLQDTVPSPYNTECILTPAAAQRIHHTSRTNQAYTRPAASCSCEASTIDTCRKCILANHQEARDAAS